ncbi:hypothetical protein CYMTET_29959 [Cymbomonas tetramitiformis]|uniref:Uncharacterized protein n=1 Tax=Cymbomonas tetramitiformis TaxID=36881 RepID=A0AAE0KUF3_9CHLO|nr:hypothetical protein CYMTET_29959 [Cymbomonas tetramitiformis]
MDETVVKSTNFFEKATARYTGTKEEDRAKFIQGFANLVEEFRRRHEAGIRHKLRPCVDADPEEEVSQEYQTEGTSTKWLIGRDGTEDTQYYWALRAFVAELDLKFMLRGTQEKRDLLPADPRPIMDGLY